jgi:phage N-6-adenine-methyltransferase
VADLTRISRGSVIRHQPELMRDEQAKADALIGYARDVKDWELFLEAITAKIRQQEEFIEAWRERVSVRHGLNRHTIENADPRSLSLDEAEDLTGIAQQQVARWKQRLANPSRYRERMIQGTLTAAEMRALANHRAEGTGENEWFTPVEYIEAARLVLEEIDLDPASNPIAQEWIKANEYFTRADDGLKHEWHGRVWLNPPYARGEIGMFVNKLLREIESGRVAAAVLLTHSYTDTEWFHNAVSTMDAVCFTRGRVKFIDDAGDPCAPTQGQAFCYYGERIEEFIEIFNAFGFVTMPCRRMAQ